MDTKDHHNSLPSATAPAEQSIFNDVLDTSQLEKSLKHARIWLYVIAGFQVLLSLIEYNTIDDGELAIVAALIDVALAALFFGLAWWSNKQPIAAFTIALIFYAGINIASMVSNPGEISGFFVLKILVVAALVKAIRSAKEISRLKASIGEE